MKPKPKLTLNTIVSTIVYGLVAVGVAAVFVTMALQA